MIANGNVRPRSKEWNRMWAALKAEFGDTVQANGYESWQYMGTEDGQHAFRHRDHPVHGRHVWYTPASQSVAS